MSDWRERARERVGDRVDARMAELDAEPQVDPEPKAPAADDSPVPVWRIGRSVGRTLYRQVGPEPSKDDVLIGVMDTRELAAQVVEAVNAMRTRLTHGGANAEDCPICKWRKDLPYPFICTGEETK